MAEVRVCFNRQTDPDQPIQLSCVPADTVQINQLIARSNFTRTKGEATCSSDVPSGLGIVPMRKVPVPGPLVCSDGCIGFRIEHPTSGVYMSPDGSVEIKLTTSDENLLSWSTNRPGVTSVIVKGETDEYIYGYNKCETGDTCLRSPSKGAKVPELSHVDICYNPDMIILYGLSVTNNVKTKLQRKWVWDINNTCNQSALILASHQIFPVDYTATLDSKQVDSKWEASGSITIANINHMTRGHMIDIGVILVAFGN
jgi:hypothetical protein